MTKLEDDDEDEQQEAADGDNKVKNKKIKNLKKQMDYHSRKRREFR